MNNVPFNTLPLVENKPLNGSVRYIFCTACRVGNLNVYLNGEWKETMKQVILAEVNGVWVCESDVCIRKAKLKAFW